MKKRPICSVEGCNSLVAPTGKRKDGSTIYKKVCSEHHKQIHGIGDWKYKKYRKDYCENRDGRLGFKCRYKIRYVGQLQVDHINGNPTDNDPQNLQTLCANCHAFKTWKNQDRKTPGRKFYKQVDKQVGKLLWS